MNYRDLMIGIIAGVAITGSIVAYSSQEKAGSANPRVLGGVLTGTPGVLSIATSADGTTVYAATSWGIYKSIDGGEVWKQLPVK